MGGNSDAPLHRSPIKDLVLGIVKTRCCRSNTGPPLRPVGKTIWIGTVKGNHCR